MNWIFTILAESEVDWKWLLVLAAISIISFIAERIKKSRQQREEQEAAARHRQRMQEKPQPSSAPQPPPPPPARAQQTAPQQQQRPQQQVVVRGQPRQAQQVRTMQPGYQTQAPPARSVGMPTRPGQQPPGFRTDQEPVFDAGTGVWRPRPGTAPVPMQQLPENLRMPSPDNVIILEPEDHVDEEQLGQVSDQIRLLRTKLGQLEIQRHQMQTGGMGQGIAPDTADADRQAGPSRKSRRRPELSNPISVRQAIIYAEVLSPPKALRRSQELWEG